MISKLLKLFEKQEKHRLHVEYWVFGRGIEMPDHSELLAKVVHEKSPGEAPLGKNEGLIFSDVRFLISIAKRARNLHAFRPDLFDAEIEPNASILTALAESDSFFRISYGSKIPILTRSPVRLLPRLARYMCQGPHSVVLDSVARQIWMADDFAALLKEHPEPDNADFQVRIHWSEANGKHRAKTLGLEKIGLPELESDAMDADQKTLIHNLLQNALQQLWTTPDITIPLNLDYFGDQYMVQFRPTKRDHCVMVQFFKVGMK